ncbi:MAG: hypothetical protein ABI651_01100 [Verrucomicrobiota bacterium]
MNLLLWRSEFGQTNHPGSLVPAPMVWQKILTAPDDSSLEILQNGKRVGRCRWQANVGEEVATGKVAPDEFEPEGMVRQLTGYTIDLEGTLLFEELENRLRFSLHAMFSANHNWQEFTLRGGVRPASWELHSVASRETMTLKVDDENGKWERSYRFEELRDPQTILRDFGMPAFLGLLGGQMKLPIANALSLGLKWEARNDWLKIGRSAVRVYRLEARLFDRYRAVVFVSRVGEILRVELPDNILLVNEALNF